MVRNTVIGYKAYQELQKELEHYKRKCEEYAKLLMKSKKHENNKT